MLSKGQLRTLMISEINHLGDVQFHQVCLEFLNFKFNQKFKNTGLNRKNRPVGYDLDGITHDSQICGEFSVDQDYFEDRLTKLRGDLTHSLARTPHPKKIILISSQSCTNLTRRKIEILFKCVAFSKKKEIYFYDANILVDELIDAFNTSEEFRRNIAVQVPLLRQTMILFGSENTLPIKDSDYVARSIENDVENIINKEKIIVLHGISGAGKSQISLNVLDKIKSKFDHVLWVNGDLIKDESSLRSYSLTRSGFPYDLLSLLKESNTILYIDSLEGKDSIIQNLHQVELSYGSRIVISCQKEVKGQGIASIHINGMSLGEFTSLINKSGKIKPETISKIHDLSAGHPLIASTIHKMIQFDNMSESDILKVSENLGGIDTGDNRSLLERLLVNHNKTLEEGISYIKTIATPRPHKAMTEKLLGPIEILKLKQRGFLSEGLEGFYKIHDLLFNVITKTDKFKPNAKWEKELINLFKERKGISELEFFQISNNHFELLKRIAWDTGDITAQYLVCTYTQIENDFDVEDFKNKLEKIVAVFDPTKVSYYEGMTCVEYYEILYRYYRHTKKDEATALAMAKAGLDFCVAGASVSNEITKHFLHHAGKFSFHTKDIPSAIDYFKKALAIDNNFHVSKLQLFRRYHWVDNDSKSTDELKQKFGNSADTQLITSILDEALTNYEGVPPSVLLHSFQELRKSPFYKTISNLLPKYKELFYKAILTTQFTNRNDYLDVLGGFGDRYAKFDPDRFLNFLSELAIPAPDLATGRTNFNLGQIYKILASEKKDRSLLSLAGLYYDKTINENRMGDFQITHIIDYLNMNAEYGKADELFQKVSKKDEAFAKFRRACTLHGLGKIDEATTEIEGAIKNLPANYKPQYEKSFLDKQNQISKNEKPYDIRSW